MLIKIGDKHKRKEMTHEQLVRTQVGGPKVSPVGKGPGITEEIGPNAGKFVDMMLNPQFIQDTFGSGIHQHIKDRRKELWDQRRVGSHTGALGMSKGGDLQYFASMPQKLFITLMWTDPTIFNDEKRLEAYLIKAGLAVKPPTDY